NSFDAMVKSGTLTVRAYDIPGEQKVCLEINDTGIGMDEETVRRMYIPFFTTKDNGTGLGLAVSSTIMESHGGYMEVKSQLDRGTTTYLYFPYE
ncbi:MAG: ATP-binding protein, partial [Eubacteriales bacterium]